MTATGKGPVLPANSVRPRHLRGAERRIRRRARAALRELESSEPALASFVMERGSELYARLDRACRSHADVRAIHRAVVRLTLIAIEATRRSA